LAWNITSAYHPADCRIAAGVRGARSLL